VSYNEEVDVQICTENGELNKNKVNLKSSSS